jgi:colanic acid biosynthesis glycosyl transferase WcaI
MKRIIFLNRYFFPDHSATSQLVSDLAFHLAERGHDVRVFTSRQLYDDPFAALPEGEVVRGVAIRRLATTRFGRAGLFGRGFDYASFYREVWRAVIEAGEPGDILVAKTDPPLLCLPALQAARRRRLLLVNWLQDLYPEVAMRLKVPLLGSPAGRILLRMRDAALRAAAANVAVGERMAAVVRDRGVPGNRLHVIPNWCDDEDIRPLSSPENPLRHEWRLEDKFVVGYSGNLGRSHEYATLLEAARRLRDDVRLVFLFIGGGSQFHALAREVSAQGLGDRFRFLPYQERAQLKYSLGVADVHWLSLRPELEGLIVPSKFYGIAAAGRPTIAITAPDGEIARLVRDNRCGFAIAPGDGPALADALRRLLESPAMVADMGRRARTVLEADFTRAQAFARWERVLSTLETNES